MGVSARFKIWVDAFNNSKWKNLGNEVAEGVGSKYTNFSLQHAMDKINFLPTLYLNREFLLSLSYKNPFLLRNTFLPQKYSYILLDKQQESTELSATNNN
ncbi:hypothetical protein BmR1_04g06500 [Babesia microti strain RI]|uniref:Uncharacterized protein n=1 Tax=Babesia microti (strain RI) TaxID=1133968 RepID=I7IHB0_BABMR|nr:hypothetical protein BmR1_04g06500 [Babesia microti strain RI]CCF75497.1 hypothetical protein BmR1_04g06500 [Babesia microti strain RI]|eukprot:XP_012649905.1 hypothetical protein BmR1_04g06500 [Babesia microti strain RI]